MKQTLYEISTDYLNLMLSLEETEGEITPEMDKALEISKDSLNTKAKNYNEIIAVKDALNLRIDEEVKRLQAIKKRNNRVIDTLKERLVWAIQIFGEFEVGLLKFGTRKSTQLIVNDASLIPDKYKVRTITESVEKNAIKNAINDGEIIEGVELIVKQNLKIT